MKTAVVKSTPKVRPWSSACEDTSMTTRDAGITQAGELLLHGQRIGCGMGSRSQRTIDTITERTERRRRAAPSALKACAR